MINKAFWSRVINALALLLFCAMVSTGSVLKFILPPGSGRVEKLFSVGGREKTVDLLLGLNRHEWGEIHFYFSIGFLAILLVHLILHWSWIRVTAWGTRQCPQPWQRKVITLFILSMILGSICLPWLFTSETLTATEYVSRYGR